ncbi:MAG: hypothetical protein GY909_18445 [Oligoflexia bacterium]|nr:hypothetical protein [Oligoflexia bacterium]
MVKSQSKLFFILLALVMNSASAMKNLDKVTTDFSKLEKELSLKKIDEKTYQSTNELGKFTIQKVIKGPTKISLEVKDQKVVDLIKNESLVLLHREESRTNLNRNFILGNPQKGRIYHFNSPTKISKVVWTKPWKPTGKSQNLKRILINMNNEELKKIK